MNFPQYAPSYDQARSFLSRCFMVACLIATLCVSSVKSELEPPDYYQCRLDSAFPAGGQKGTSVTVELRGRKGGLAVPESIVIDGPPGITVGELEAIENNNTVRATLNIANDAEPGRRWIRVASAQSGLTNFAHFVVGDLPEHVEKESNSTLDEAEKLQLPVVVNGRINPKADRDCFRFTAKKDQNLVLAVAAHSLDVHGQGGNYGFADFSLELLDEQERIVAESLDKLGFDPLIEYRVPADGTYVARIKMVAYNGFPEAVYRLTIGEVPYVTSVFPTGLQKGVATRLQLFGPNIPPGTSRLITASKDHPFPLQHVSMTKQTSGHDIPLILGDLGETTESEPNNNQSQAIDLPNLTTANGRFDSRDDVDWYRVRVTDKRSVWLQIHAHRFLRSPVDTFLQVYDSDGKLLQENDDDRSVDYGYMSFHGFRDTTDSGILLQPKEPGDYFVRVSDTRGTFGLRAVYRLSRSDRTSEPDFRLRHYPDAVPVWGPGSTAALQVQVDWLTYRNFNVELSIAGLPDGWKSSTGTALGTTKERPSNPHQNYVFLTITAPPDVKPGTVVPFHVIGRVQHEGKMIERVSYPLSWMYSSDTGFFRIAPQSRAAVARSNGPWLESTIASVTIKQGTDASIPVRIHGANEITEMPLVVNIATGIRCNLGPPVTLPIRNGIASVPLTSTSSLPVGHFYLTVAQTWRSDIRIGMPGPCTQAIRLDVVSR